MGRMCIVDKLAKRKKADMETKLKRIVILFGMADLWILLGILLEQVYHRGHLGGWLIGFVSMHGIGYLYFRYGVCHAYGRMKKTMQNFKHGDIYDELFVMEDSISPEVEQVFEKFRELIDKSDLLNVSRQQAQYLALQNQINPHFLYNTLESIRSDALCSGMDDIARITEALSRFFRYTISNLDKLSTLSDELENVENYFMIQKYRFEDRLNLQIDIPEGENIQNLKLPKLTLQPIVENAILHGLECSADQGVVSIQVELTDQGYCVTVADNGMGMSPEQLYELNEQLSAPGVNFSGASNKKGGIALRNVAQRMKLIYGDQYGIHVYSTVHVGTKVVVWLPVEYEEG